jgi:hypothetical protein
MTFGWSYPAGGAGYRNDPGVRHKCSNAHVWDADMYSELGGAFYRDDRDAYCPECGEYGEIE